MPSFASHSLEETQKIAKEWLSHISNTYKDSDTALVVGLSGHLGAGKTAFVKATAKELGIVEEVTSPTFVIMKSYEITIEVRPLYKHLIHIDAYRLEKGEDLEALNWEELISDKGNLIMIEWPENVGMKEFEKEAHISFEIQDDAHMVLIE